MYRIPITRRPEKLAVQHRTAVCGASKGCGVSFVSGLIAREITRRPQHEASAQRREDFAKNALAVKPQSAHREASSQCTLAELCRPYFYNALNIERRFSDGSFLFYEDVLAMKKSLYSVRNSSLDLNLFLRRPDSEGFASPQAACKMPGEEVVFDLSSADDSYLEEVLFEADDIYLVIDPLPSKLMEGCSRIEKLRLIYPDIRLVVNKMNKGVRRAELKKFLAADFTELPFVPPETIYKAEYNCILPADVRGFDVQLTELNRSILL